jgi:fructoselysine-6-P-deglycase FrlB-like protein
VPALILATDPKTSASVEKSAERLRSAGSPLLVISNGPVSSHGVEQLALPEGPSGPLCTPVTGIVGLALIEAIATGRGLNPDAPPGLTKVTKTL